MAASMKVMMTCMVLACMVVAAPMVAEAAITCGQVASAISPCIGYLRTGGGSVPGPCCSGVSALNRAASTTADRQTTCRCLQAAAKALPPAAVAMAGSLPSKCRVNVPYAISPSTNCATVK